MGWLRGHAVNVLLEVLAMHTSLAAEGEARWNLPVEQQVARGEGPARRL